MFKKPIVTQNSRQLFHAVGELVLEGSIKKCDRAFSFGSNHRFRSNRALVIYRLTLLVTDQFAKEHCH